MCEEPATSTGVHDGSSTAAEDSGGTVASTSAAAESSGGGSSSADAGASGSGESSGVGGESSSDGGGSSSGGGALAYDCPAVIVDGINTFSGVDLPDRQVSVERFGSGGPLSLYWHGTGGSIAQVANASQWSAPANVRSVISSEGGIFVIPGGDPDAITRPNDNVFPWWIAGDPEAPEETTDRMDDFLLADAVIGCLAGEYDADRISSSGFSAGAIMTAHLAEARDDLAGVTIWSGGAQLGHTLVPQGTVPAMVLHGGPFDQYCGTGAPIGCFSFQEPSEALAADFVAAGHFAFLCDHQNGHSYGMEIFGAEFLRSAVLGVDHPLVDYPFGPTPPSGAIWMFDNYCYSVGDPSPWQ